MPTMLQPTIFVYFSISYDWMPVCFALVFLCD